MTLFTRTILMPLIASALLAAACLAEAATFTVDRTDDVTATGCAEATPTDCSLRGALTVANALAGPDAIVVPAGTYTLHRGVLTIEEDVIITGAGASTTIIQTCAVPQKTAPCPAGRGVAERVFETINVVMDVDIADITIRHGRAEGTGLAAGGGGIRNEVGPTLTLTGVVVADSTSGSEGGGLFNRGPETLILIDSTVSGNTAPNGGGIANIHGGTTHIIGSTISGNTALDSGGGLLNRTGGNTTLTNSTVSGNTAGGDGGGIMNFGTSVALLNVTITDNHAGGIDTGGGGVANSFGGPLTLASTLIAGNTGLAGTGPDCAGELTSQGHNLVGDASGCAITGVTTGNVTGIDPLLGPLTDNGGPTFTHALLATSPAIDAGDAAACPAGDQRGALRPQDGNGSGGAICDIGAYEAGEAPGTTIPLQIVGQARFVLGTTPAAADRLVETATFTVPPSQTIDPFTEAFELTLAEPGCGGVFSRLSLPAGAFRPAQRGTVAVFTGRVTDAETGARVNASIRLARRAGGAYRAALDLRDAGYDCLQGAGPRTVTLALAIGDLTAEGGARFRRLASGSLRYP
jgi:hypothetical protein